MALCSSPVCIQVSKECLILICYSQECNRAPWAMRSNKRLISSNNSSRDCKHLQISWIFRDSHYLTLAWFSRGRRISWRTWCPMQWIWSLPPTPCRWHRASCSFRASSHRAKWIITIYMATFYRRCNEMIQYNNQWHGTIQSREYRTWETWHRPVKWATTTLTMLTTTRASATCWTCQYRKCSACSKIWTTKME